jgi:hypothetical protein
VRGQTKIHTAQILLVEADDAEQAFRIVADKLDGGDPQWSDWHEASGDPSSMNFAGRWTGQIFMTPEQMKKLSNNEEVDLSENPNHLRFSDDPALADEVIARHLGYRLQEIENYRNTLATDYAGVDVFTYEYDPNKNDYKKSMALYYTKKLAGIMSNDWSPDSGIYDLHDWDATLEYFYKRVQKSPERQFLIPVDFHY